MILTFLGAGDMFSFNQGHNSILVEFGDSNNLVVDFPESNWKALRAMGKDMTDVKNLFISHLHEDHINGLQLLGNYCRVYGKDKPHLYVHNRLLPQLWETLQYGMAPTTAGTKELGDYFHVHGVDEAFELSGVTFQLIKTKHVPGMISHGLLAAPFYYFSGDTSLDADLLVELGNKVEVIFHECHLQTAILKSHTSLEDILSLPDDVRKRVVLMHYEDKYSDPGERERLHKKSGLRIAAAGSVYTF